jgi:thiol:disulfide interchange protein
MKSNKLKSAILFLIGIIPFFVQSQIEYADEKIKWKFKVEQKGCEGTIIADVQCAPHWHFCPINMPAGSFGFPTKIVVQKNKDIELIGKFTEPKPITKHDEAADEDVAYHEGRMQFKQKFKTLSSKPFKINISYEFQACDESHCLAPFSAKAVCTAEGCEIVETTSSGDSLTAENTTVTSVKNGKTKDKAKTSKSEIKKQEKKKSSKSILTIFILSFLSGLAALLTPCVFPMIPMTVTFFTKRSKDVKTGKRNAIIYGLSIIGIYVALGTIVTGIFGGDSLNAMSTAPSFNFIFFLILIVFAVSFMGAFEIRMPSSWVNKADAKADKGGLIGIFFMALVLALVSFSCTGPIVGSLLIEASRQGGLTPVIGMFGFSLALALPFTLFALFPSWLNSLPSSGGWLNTVKVVLGLLELALAFKFLSNADMSLQLHFLERETFIAIWIGIFTVLALYLLGFVRFPHDDKMEKVSVGRGLFGTFVLAFVIYMLPGMWGAPLKLINAFPPPSYYSESPTGFGGSGNVSVSNEDKIEGTELGPQGIQVFHDYDKALAYAEKVGKPLFVDFTGHNCVNCRRMEEGVWGEEGVIDHLRGDVVIASLHVDERVELPKTEQKTVTVDGRQRKIVTVGDKWSVMQMEEYNISAQPYYVMIGKEGKQIPIGPASYETHRNPDDFKKWLEDGLKAYKK